MYDISVATSSRPDSTSPPVASATASDADPGASHVQDTPPAVVQHVMQAVIDRKEAYVSLLTRLARIETPSTDPETIYPAFDLLADELAHAGIESMHLPGQETAGSLYARPADRPAGAPIQFLLGHVDTVWPLGTLGRMPVVEKDGKLRGPGVFDMKAGLTSFVIALQTLFDLGLSLPAAPVLLITSDEEIGSHESRRHIERLARCASRVYVSEPGLGHRGKLKTARKGTGEYVIYVSPSGNGGNGESPIVPQMMRLVQLLHNLGDAERGITVNVGTLRGPSTDDPRGSLGVDVRVVTKEDAYVVDRELREGVAALFAGTDVAAEVQGGVERPPLERTPGNRRLWHAAVSIARDMDLVLEEDRAGGASDGNFTSPFAPTLDGLGAVGDGAHADHEFAYIDATVQRCALLALLLLVPVDA